MTWSWKLARIAGIDVYVHATFLAKRVPGMTNARRNYFVRLNNSLQGLLSIERVSIAVTNKETGQLEEVGFVAQSDYPNINEVPNVRWLALGTENFGRDVLTELVAATRVSLLIGFVAGLVATSIWFDFGVDVRLYRWLCR